MHVVIEKSTGKPTVCKYYTAIADLIGVHKHTVTYNKGKNTWEKNGYTIFFHVKVHE